MGLSGELLQSSAEDSKEADMANVFHKTTYEYRRSVNTPDYSPVEWAINPDVSALITAQIPQRYWKWDPVISAVVEMSEAEKAQRDQSTLVLPRTFVERLQGGIQIDQTSTKVYEYAPEQGVAYVEYVRFSTNSSTLYLTVEVDGIEELILDLSDPDYGADAPPDWPSTVRKAVDNRWLVQPSTAFRITQSFGVYLTPTQPDTTASLLSGEVAGRSGYLE